MLKISKTTISEVTLRRLAPAGFKVYEPCAGKLARTIFMGPKLPEWVIWKMSLEFGMLTKNW